MTQKKQEPRWTTPRARLSFPYLAKPREPDEPGKKPMFEATLIFDIQEVKSPEYKALEQAAVAAARAAWPKLPLDKIGFPFKKGEEKTNAEGEAVDGYEVGSKFFAAKSPSRPLILDEARNEVDGEVLYAGCYVVARVAVYTYDYQGKKKGVGFGLRGIQKVGDGEPFGGGGRSTAEEFGAVSPSPLASSDPLQDRPEAPGEEDLPF